MVVTLWLSCEVHESELIAHDSNDTECAPPMTGALNLFAINVQLTWAKK